jgi:hypothetical protein
MATERQLLMDDEVGTLDLDEAGVQRLILAAMAHCALQIPRTHDSDEALSWSNAIERLSITFRNAF